MRITVLLLLILSSLASGGSIGRQDSHETYGKTESQILALGFSKWMTFYTGKAGNSTADMNEAADIYGEVATRRNDRLIKNEKNPKRKAALLKLRDLLGAFDSASIDVAYAESGGGTMYSTMWASVTGEVEDTLFELISHGNVKGPHRVVSDVSKALRKLGLSLEKLRKDPDMKDIYNDKYASKGLAKMKASYDQIVSVARAFVRHDSDLILGFCLQRVQNALDEEQ